MIVVPNIICPHCPPAVLYLPPTSFYCKPAATDIVTKNILFYILRPQTDGTAPTNPISFAAAKCTPNRYAKAHKSGKTSWGVLFVLSSGQERLSLVQV